MNRYDTLMQRIVKGERILIDGGTGTEVERRGVPQVDNAWNGGGALTHPEIVRQIHEDYIEQGAEIVISNTFATGRHILQDAGWGEHFDLLNRRSVELAIEARENQQRPEVLVAGGVSHWYWVNKPSLNELQVGVEEQAAIMAEAGVELIMLEMMIEIDRMLVLIEACQKTGLPVWPGLTCELDDQGVMRLEGGETLEDAIAALTDKNIPLINIMHTDVKYVDACLKIVQNSWSGPIGVYAHSGEYTGDQWIFDGVISPDDYTAAAEHWLQQGIQVIGGCCGIGVAHIASLQNLIK